MAIRRSERRTHYTNINQAIFDDERLDCKDLGVLVYLLSKPDNWQTNAHQLSERFDCNVNTIKRILRNLETFGYLLRQKKRATDGTIYWESTVFETPTMGQKTSDGKTSDGKTSDGKTSDGKLAHITNTELINIELTKTDLTKTELEATHAKKSVSGAFEQFRDIYNQYRPRHWSAIDTSKPVSQQRQKVFKNLIRDCGGLEPAIAAMTNALLYAQSDSWCQSVKLTFENFATNNKIIQWHERYLSQFDSGIPPELDTPANRKTAIEVQRMADFLKRRKEAQ